MTEVDEIVKQGTKLEAIIERYMPTAAQEPPASWQGKKRSEHYVCRFLAARNAPLRLFGLGPPAKQWAKVKSAASALEEALKGLGADGWQELKWTMGSNGDYRLAQEAEFIAQVLKDECAYLENHTRNRRKAGKKRNWPAVAVAKEAREIWGIEKWHSSPEKYGNEPVVLNWLLCQPMTWQEAAIARQRQRQYLDLLRDCAPRTANDAPGEFGRFLNEILEQLDIKSTAASALRSLGDVTESE